MSLSRTRRWLGAMLGLVLCACGEDETVAPPALISGTYDVVRVGELVFVTSADRDELRALDISARPRDFVRAPNPLEPLSIPVLDRPVALAGDVRYEDGQEVWGPYVYARSAGGSAISVVAADVSRLEEVRRLQAAELGMEGPVTAFAAQGPLPGRPTSALYYAIQGAARATLWRVDLPEPDALPAAALMPRPLFDSADGESIAAIVVLPEEGRIAVGLRSKGGEEGRTLLVTGAGTGTPQVAPLPFPGPVRRLVTHGRAEGFEAGRWIYGLLDEAACAASATCSGVVAVDTSNLSEGAKGPLELGGALPTGLAIAPAARLKVPVGDGLEEQTRMVGIVPTSSGELFIFDAANLSHFDLRESEPGVQPYGFRVDTTVPALQPYRLPGGVVWAPSQEAAYVAYPSADGILQVNLPAVIPGQANANSLLTFE